MNPDLPAAAARPAGELLAGAGQGVVLAPLSAAVLLARPDGRVISLLARQASGSPNGIRLELDAGCGLFAGIEPGTAWRWQAGRLRLDRWTITITRTWDPAVPRIRPHTGAIDRIGAVAPVLGVPREPVDRLAAALASGAGVASAVRGLLGLGLGLTPAGDDVLAGALAGLHAMGRRDLVAAMLPGLTDRATATTALSAELLLLAGAGWAGTETLAVLRQADTRAGSPDGMARALRALLAVGHTSGADLAAGLAIGLAVPAAVGAGR